MKMPRALAKSAAVGALATAALVASSNSAFAESWEYEGTYPTLADCQYYGRVLLNDMNNDIIWYTCGESQSGFVLLVEHLH